jgi:hypothetical protein
MMTLEQILLTLKHTIKNARIKEYEYLEEEENVILIIFAQEPPDSELWLKRYRGKKFGVLKYEFGKVYGLIWKIPGALVKMICNLVGVEGLNYKIGGLRIEL